MQLEACRSPEEFVASIKTVAEAPYPVWHDHCISLCPNTIQNLEKFITINRQWLYSCDGTLPRQNPAIGSALNQLARRITREYEDHPEAQNLCKTITSIASRMALSGDIIGLILDKLPSGNYFMPRIYGRLERLSKAWREHARLAKARWINNHRVNLFDLQFPDHEACLKFSMRCGSDLHHLDLVSLRHLTDADLDRLLTACPNLKTLYLDNYSLSQNPIERLTSLRNLTSLRLRLDNPAANLAEPLAELPRLSKLSLVMHPSSSQIPNLKPLTNLKTLTVIEGKGLMDVKQISELSTLRILCIQDSPWLSSIPPLGSLTHLSSLNVWNCDRLTKFESLSGCVNLRNINLWNCPLISQLPEFNQLTSLEVLHLTQCFRIAELPEIYHLTKLADIDIWNCDALTALPAINPKAPLKRIRINYCRTFNKLPSLADLQNLEELHLTHCLTLKNIYGISELGHLRVLNLNGSYGLRSSVLWSVSQLKQRYPYISVIMPYS